MANIKSALKRAKIARIRTVRNAAYKSMMKTAVRRFENALKGADLEAAKDTLVRAIRVIDKLAAKGIIHKNMAARKKSRLTRRLNKTAS
ncbi:MAG: 30S ribosomal protein S20 [Bacillota bacterium]|jgi:small subunit ribosomal protein S20|uniref:Small ribosomal subunit protein bS20 n=1 Tax=Thermanaerosceptrum fracticalcis TaxID=1712410 RepID=A0A7G6E272_THEFR|nr:30S ribosomal protein S20 [Thermanaerosceptrum fracticalcis]MBZ4653301.1 ribosomal protein [Peptococcaceae bacterium]QNB46176.1 30S ribosomal protein S20 [Thermanaerosceptrum fracticalcis]